MLKYEVPVVYDIIMTMTTKGNFQEPSLLMIKTVCKNSNDLSLKKPKFKRYLNEYAITGLFCKRGKFLTAKRKCYYEAIRRKKLEKYIKENKKIIESMAFDRTFQIKV